MYASGGKKKPELILKRLALNMEVKEAKCRGKKNLPASLWNLIPKRFYSCKLQVPEFLG